MVVAKHEVFDKSENQIQTNATQTNKIKDSVASQTQIEGVARSQITKEKNEQESSLISTTPGHLVFPNGDTYTGAVKNGKMHGKGRYWFKSGGLISKNDPMERTAKAGDYVEGDWVDGELYIGYHFAENGTKKERIVIGRN